MRVNVYAEEMTNRIEIISKEIEGRQFTGLRFYLELPVTVNGEQVSGPFMHHPGDDDSAAVTFWGKTDLRAVLLQALDMLNQHYDVPRQQSVQVEILGPDNIVHYRRPHDHKDVAEALRTHSYSVLFPGMCNTGKAQELLAVDPAVNPIEITTDGTRVWSSKR